MGFGAKYSSVIKGANGTILKDVNSVRARWRDYFQDLYDVQNPTDECSVADLETASSDELPTPGILVEDMEAALGRIKMGKWTMCQQKN